MTRNPANLLLALLLAALPGTALAQTALPLDAVESGSVSGGADALYDFMAPTVGVLMVAVNGDGDLTLSVRDADGQELPDASSDRDLLGRVGSEQFSVIIPEPGRYQVAVGTYTGSSQIFEIGGAFLSFPAFAQPLDPDRRPSQAAAVALGEDHEDALDADTGDYWDWFVITPDQGGVVTLVLRPTSGDPDLILEAYLNDDFSDPAARSDQDLQDTRGNESTTVMVDAGQAVYVKVLGFGSSTSGGYRLSSSLIP